MSLRSRVARTTFTSLTGLALAGASLVALPGTAHAAAISSATMGASRFLNEVGPATCNIVNPSGSGGAPFELRTVPETVTGAAAVISMSMSRTS